MVAWMCQWYIIITPWILIFQMCHVQIPNQFLPGNLKNEIAYPHPLPYCFTAWVNIYHNTYGVAAIVCMYRSRSDHIQWEFIWYILSVDIINMFPMTERHRLQWFVLKDNWIYDRTIAWNKTLPVWSCERMVVCEWPWHTSPHGARSDHIYNGCVW